MVGGRARSDGKSEVDMLVKLSVGGLLLTLFLYSRVKRTDALVSIN